MNIGKEVIKIERQIRSSMALIIADLVNDSSNMMIEKFTKVNEEKELWKRRCKELANELEVLKKNLK